MATHRRGRFHEIAAHQLKLLTGEALSDAYMTSVNKEKDQPCRPLRSDHLRLRPGGRADRALPDHREQAEDDQQFKQGRMAECVVEADRARGCLSARHGTAQSTRFPQGDLFGIVCP